MRLIKITAPAGRGADVVRTAFAAGIERASLHEVATYKADGTSERKEVVDLETSTPKGKHFTDLLLAAPFYNAKDFTVVNRRGLSVFGSESLREITKPLPEVATDIAEELFQFSHITYSFVGRVLIAACLLAYGMIQQNLLLMIAGLLFLPLLPLLQAIGFGAWTRVWKLSLQGLAAFALAIVLLVAGGALVASLCEPPMKYQEFSSLAVGFLISLGVGAAAGLAIIDDTGKREMIGLAASAQMAIIPVWVGISLVFGFQAATQKQITERFLSFFLNVVTLVVAALAVHVLSGAANRRLGAVKKD